MIQTTSGLFKGLLVTAGVALATGCVSQSSLDEVKAMASKASQDAAAALSMAKSASSAASAASDAAARAQRTADSAASAANESQQCCVRTNEKMDRMFQDMMKK